MYWYLRVDEIGEGGELLFQRFNFLRVILTFFDDTNVQNYEHIENNKYSNSSDEYGIRHAGSNNYNRFRIYETMQLYRLISCQELKHQTQLPH